MVHFLFKPMFPNFILWLLHYSINQDIDDDNDSGLFFSRHWWNSFEGRFTDRPVYLWKRLILRFWYGALCHFLPEITCSSTFFFFSSISVGSKCLFDLQLCRPLYFSFFGGPFFFFILLTRKKLILQLGLWANLCIETCITF